MSSNTVKNSSDESRQQHVESRYDMPKGVDKVLWGALLEAEIALLVAQGRCGEDTLQSLKEIILRVKAIRNCVKLDAILYL